MLVEDSDYNIAMGTNEDEEGGGNTFADDENDVLGTAFTRKMKLQSVSMHSPVPFLEK